MHPVGLGVVAFECPLAFEKRLLANGARFFWGICGRSVLGAFWCGWGLCTGVCGASRGLGLRGLGTVS